MEKTFAAHDNEGFFVIVKASSKGEAFEHIIKLKTKDEILIDHITEFIVNGSLLENFYMDEKGYFLDDDTGEFVERLNHMSEQDLEEYIDNCIETNVRTFWEDKQEFAEEYLDELKKSKGYETYVGNFSDDFMFDAVRRVLINTNWMNDIEIVEVDFTEKKIQIISQS
ncbi:hypothetical protein [Alkalihalobacterium alkalinitrilicum]|uniref:hypothetical protein n=1 Tax=Alkalihalobacterium alkalinitrilicum TaxID=427920 RepID=UPI0009958295|nr:hypothetical protein [Alkalihalobacterium alkalinitrilicum]